MQLDNLRLEQKFEDVNRNLIKGKNNKAIKILNKLLEKDPISDEAWLLLGISKRRIGRIEDAIDCFKMATELNPEREEAWGLYTITLIDQGLIEEAQNIIEKAGELNPNNKKIQFYRENLIHVYDKFGPFF